VPIVPDDDADEMDEMDDLDDLDDSDESDTPVQDTLEIMTVGSIENCELEPRELMLVRLAALVAVDAPAASYLMNTGVAIDVGITLEDVQDVLVAVAPIVGTARVVSATGEIGEALGFAVGAMFEAAALDDDEDDLDED
jgi:hypothetical protein